MREPWHLKWQHCLFIYYWPPTKHTTSRQKRFWSECLFQYCQLSVASLVKYWYSRNVSTCLHAQNVVTAANITLYDCTDQSNVICWQPLEDFSACCIIILFKFNLIRVIPDRVFWQNKSMFSRQLNPNLFFILTNKSETLHFSTEKQIAKSFQNH